MKKLTLKLTAKGRKEQLDLNTVNQSKCPLSRNMKRNNGSGKSVLLKGIKILLKGTQRTYS